MRKELQSNTLRHLSEIENSLINENLIPVSTDSKLGKLFKSLFKKLPSRYLIPTTLALSAIASACSFDANNGDTPESSLSTPNPTPIEKVIDQNSDTNNPRRFLSLPFAESSGMKIQQGWIYTFGNGAAHKGIDYIDGTLDDASTWRSFPVLAAADGEACDPNKKQGNAVFIEHNVNGEIFRTYYGHLKDVLIKLPSCSAKDKTHVKRGEQIGTAGATGVKDDQGRDQPTWIHLHFQVNDSNDNSIDPYDLNTTRDAYPDPNLTNEKICGEKTLWKNCPISNSASGGPLENGQINVEIRFADNLPVLDTKLDLYTEEKDINGNPVLGEKIKEGSSGKAGLALFDTTPGTYVLIFDPYGNTRIYGERFRPDVDNPGIADVTVEKGKTTKVKVTLGRVIVNNINEWGGKQLQNLALSSCANARGKNDNLYQVLCVDANDLGKERLDILPGNYDITYHWWNYTAKIGTFSLEPGQTLTFTCRTYEPTISGDGQPAKCD